ncbi:hypothetical protein SZ60_11970, partial [Frigoribacterium sp. MEB024]
GRAAAGRAALDEEAPAGSPGTVAAAAGSAVRAASSVALPSVAAPWERWERRENFMSRVSGRAAIKRL